MLKEQENRHLSTILTGFGLERPEFLEFLNINQNVK